MRIPRPIAGLSSLLAMIGLSACGGGGSSSAPPTEDLTGFWQLFLTPTGSSTEAGPSAVYLDQTGAVIAGAGITGSMSGSTISLQSQAGTLNASFQGTASASAASGTVAFSGALNATGTFRLARFVPTGTLSVAGTIGSSPVNLSTSSAIGGRDYTDLGLSVLDEIEIVCASSTEHFEIDFSAAGMTTGALTVPGTVTATVLYRTGNDVVETASTGTLTVTQYDDSGFAGSFVLAPAAGGSITGSFAVGFDISAYDP